MRILLASPIDKNAIQKLRESHEVIDAAGAPSEVLRERIADCQAVVFRSGVSITGKLMASAPDLRLLIRAGSGLDNIDLAYVDAHGLTLARIPEPGAQAVAELAFTLMLALARQITTADAQLRRGHWLKHKLTGHLLTGKTLGVYGCGNIGARVAHMGAAWGMNVVACVRNPSPAREAAFAKQGITLTTNDRVLGAADFLSIHVPLDDSTRRSIGKEALARVKAGAFLVNLARGGIVVEEALRDALVGEHLAGAGLDVHEREGEGEVSPLADLSNVILTPHVGAGTVDTQRAVGERVLAIIAEFAGSGQPRGDTRNVGTRPGDVLGS